MLFITIALGGVLLLILSQLIAVAIYLRQLKSYRDFSATDDELPEALVILSLRGGDEGLTDCLNGLANQEYPRYQLRIVIDHPTDPATAIVDRWLRSVPHMQVSVEFLAHVSQWSTVKCSGVRQALRNVDREVGAVVLVDGDAVTYPDWLRDLIAPLLQENIGAVTGNRWYSPADYAAGSWCRYIYNGLALPAMKWFDLTWGGSIAMRREVALSHAFWNKLENASSEDKAVRGELAETGLRLHFNPRVILLNSEGCSLASCSQFVFRQLLWTRMYHPAWLPILVHAIANYLTLASSFVVAAIALCFVDYRQAGMTLLGALGAYAAVVAGSLLATDEVIRQVALTRQGVNRPSNRLTQLRVLVMAVVTSPVTLLMYTWAILRAAIASRVVWRGVRYAVYSSGRIEVLAHAPLVSESAPAVRSRSAA